MFYLSWFWYIYNHTIKQSVPCNKDIFVAASQTTIGSLSSGDQIPKEFHSLTNNWTWRMSRRDIQNIAIIPNSDAAAFKFKYSYVSIQSHVQKHNLRCNVFIFFWTSFWLLRSYLMVAKALSSPTESCVCVCVCVGVHFLDFNSKVWRLQRRDYCARRQRNCVSGLSRE